MNWFVHYTVTMPPKGPQHLTAGPYNEDEVLIHRVDIAGYAGVTDAFVSPNPKHPKEA